MLNWLRNLYVDRNSYDPGARHMRWFLATFGLVLLVSAVGSIPFAVITWQPWLRFVGLALLVGSTGFSSGALLGFLFGVPRANRGAGTDGTSGSDNKWLSNTNLEEVSDWLTKMVVGVSLVEFANLNDALTNFALQVDHAIPAVPNAGFAASLVLVGSAVSGFMLSYLKSRTSLMLAFDALGAAKAQINQVGQSSFVAEARKIIQYPLLVPDPAAVSAAANMLAAVPPKPSDADTLRLVGFAQAILKNFSGASEALGKAAQLDPDPDLKILAARTAAVSGNVSAAKAMLPAVPVGSAAPMSASDFEAELARLFVALYDDSPGSCDRAIEIGERLAQDPAGKTSPRVWLYLASAYGQSYSEQQSKGAAQANLQTTRDKALDAVGKALEFDRRNNLPVLQMLWQVRYPGKPANENDLEVFSDDPDFKALLGSGTVDQTESARPLPEDTAEADSAARAVTGEAGQARPAAATDTAQPQPTR